MLLKIILTLLLVNPVSNVYFINKPFFSVSEKAAAPVRINLENIGVKVQAERFVVIDVNSGELLLQKNSNVRQALASITKLMTALVILDQKPDWQKVVEMQKIDETNGAFPHIYRGEQMRFIDLWKAALISSDNNAIKAMMRTLGLSEEEFAAEMNERAVILGMRNTVFVEATGLDPKNLSTAIDIAILLSAAMQRNEIRETVLQSEYTFKIINTNKSRRIFNTDILVDSFLNQRQNGYELIGGKTGYLQEAGYCLAVAISRNNHPIIVVVLDASSSADRFQDVKVIADWVYSNYEWAK